MARFDSFGGGLARGIQAGSQTALQGLSLAQQRKKMLAEQQQEQITRFNAIGDKTLEAVQQLVEGAASRGLDPRSPEVKAAIDQIVEPTVNTLTQARANGIPARDPEMLRRQINALQFGTPSQQESLAGTRATSQAQAEGTAAGKPPEPKRRETVVRAGTPEARELNLDLRGDEVGIVEFETDPQTGQERITNVSIPGRGVQVNVGGQAAQSEFTEADFLQAEPDIEPGSFELAVGPIDALLGASRTVPVISDIVGEVGGEETGLPQRRAKRLMEALENSILIAAQPGEGRPSNFRLQLAAKRVPSFGAFASEAGSQEDLEEIVQTSRQELRSQIQILNDPRIDGSARDDALTRARELGKVISIGGALLGAGQTPSVQIARLAGVEPTEFTPEETLSLVPQISTDNVPALIPTLQRMTSEDRLKVISSMTDEQKRALQEAMSGTQ